MKKRIRVATKVASSNKVKSYKMFHKTISTRVGISASMLSHTSTPLL